MEEQCHHLGLDPFVVMVLIFQVQMNLNKLQHQVLVLKKVCDLKHHLTKTQHPSWQNLHPCLQVRQPQNCQAGSDRLMGLKIQKLCQLWSLFSSDPARRSLHPPRPPPPPPPHTAQPPGGGQ